MSDAPIKPTRGRRQLVLLVAVFVAAMWAMSAYARPLTGPGRAGQGGPLGLGTPLNAAETAAQAALIRRLDDDTDGIEAGIAQMRLNASVGDRALR